MVYQELSKLFAKEKPDVAQSLSALLGGDGVTAGTLGTGAPLSYTASVGVNITYGLFVEYQKYKLVKEKEEREKAAEAGTESEVNESDSEEVGETAQN